MSNLPEDPTLDEIRCALAPLIARHAAFDGWNAAAVDSAAQEVGLDLDLARLAFDAERKGGNPVAMIDAWFDSIDAAMLARVGADRLAGMGVSARVTALVEARFALLAPDREALRRAIAILALPQHTLHAAQLSWRSADRIWRAAGDTAADFNHYSKRATLAAAYAASVLVFLDDESEDLAETRAFLARRIAGLARFGKTKARMADSDRHFSLARFVGRLRYPVH